MTQSGAPMLSISKSAICASNQAADQVGDTHPENIAALEFGEKAHKTPFSRTQITRRVRNLLRTVFKRSTGA